jgi:ABC-type uncharacterized transport system involved in gliding motility auxiliary subunit
MKSWYKKLLVACNIILYLVLIALWISIPDVLGLNIPLTVFNLTLTGLVVVLYRDSFKKYYLTEHFKKLTDTIVFVGLIFLIGSLANYWAYKHPKQMDTSLFKMNSLSDQTKNVLKNIKDEVHFTLLSRKTESSLWLPLMEFYRNEKNNIIVDKIDIDVRPDLVTDYHLTEASALVVEYHGRRQMVTERDELNITNALIKITRVSDPVVYFVSGHGEGSFTSKDPDGLQFIYEAMKSSALEVRPLNLLSSQAVPFDAKALVIWGPKTALQNNEISLVEEFLKRGGRVLLGLDPDLNGDQHHALRNLFAKYNINIRNDLVVDKKSFVNGSEGSIPLFDTYNHEHPITKKFKGQVFFPLCSSVANIKESDKNITLLMSTSDFPASWGETSLTEIANKSASFTKGKDIPGPLSVAAAYEDAGKKIVVFGNSTFVLNAYLKFGANYTLFLNSLSWLVDEDRLISFNLPIIQSEPVFISAPQLGIVFYFSVIFTPLVLFGVAILVYRRRRDN